MFLADYESGRLRNECKRRLGTIMLSREQRAALILHANLDSWLSLRAYSFCSAALGDAVTVMASTDTPLLCMGTTYGLIKLRLSRSRTRIESTNKSSSNLDETS